ncbi:MAG: hypothetical protein HPY30_09990 [Gammaproteobacteria bacterium (ex Lamellibrachia satsuma)]|nr:MAG: hypothetical protein HPY30_09990 [Gammaproteobacteria bacterium (ex Lamellibrachia satsuma)]
MKRFKSLLPVVDPELKAVLEGADADAYVEEVWQQNRKQLQLRPSC